MSLSAAIQNQETVHHDSQHTAASFANFSANRDVNMQVEADEEEDVDFNPFLIEETSSEASSSLSSEIDGPGENAEKNIWSSVDCQDDCQSLQRTDEEQGNVRDFGNEEETVMQTRLEEANGRESVPGDPTKTELTSSIDHDRSLICPIIQIDDEDAICRRTRARHSLANYTLEELETFLQESDDDELRNVDDEEEYRKFLAAVLLGGIDNGQTEQEDGHLDEDEENDADFVIEIEEALESDVDEGLDNNESWNDKRKGVETRQKKHLKESFNNKECLGKAKLPLRPILPYRSNSQAAPLPTLGWQSSPRSFSYCSPSLSGTDLINGFTVHQIGQLYCLVYEHVQLLIQAFSVCVLDPSRQEVAAEIRKMISEMAEKREEALTCRKFPHPVLCFNPQNLHSSLHYDFHQTSNCSSWTPLIDNPVSSVLDVAPLGLAKRYMSDVSATVLRYRRSHLENVGDKSHLEREPLFPLPILDSFGETDCDTLGRTTTMSSPGQLLPKKSLAATLVESTKKESVALVPKDIAKLAQRFYPLFNSAMFPHKPPIPAVAHRVLFTDSEDGLLAMGLMEYNNDWTAIQRRFLPCKSQHQIFVRQKNRSSSKASENPIKAVRRMKASPLTAAEMAGINEGQKVFKHDWLSIWKFFVPHRDPSLLSRQWRVATGTHKSYKKNDACKEKRRLYEAKRRKVKSLTDWQTSSEKVDNGENMADDIDDEDEAYVHEAFLADRSNIQSTNIIPHRSTHISEKCAAITDDRGESQQEAATSSKPLGAMNSSSHILNVRYSASLTSSFTSNSISRPSRSCLGSWPTSTRRSKGVRVVKLAPDLPPVNLPSSVRVLSQSTFKRYDGGQSYSKTGDNAAINPFHWPPQFSNKGTASPQPRNKISRQQDEGILADQHVAEENTSESDLHMHPLLFETSEQISSYYPVNCTVPGTYNFFPEIPLQAESNLHMSQNLAATHIDTIPHSEAAPMNLRTIDFHPLLQRFDTVCVDSAVMSSVDRPSGDLKSLQGDRDRLLNPSDCTLREPQVGESRLETDTSSSSQYEEENNLDLDIHLCSLSNKDKTTKGIDMSKHLSVAEGVPTLHHKMVEKGLDGDKLLLNHSDKCPENSYDESVPEIVMEQEELSDSDEELQHVEFECEEMDDSEGEGLEGEQPTKIQTKEELLILAAKEAGVQAIDDPNQTHQPGFHLTQVSVNETGKSCASPMQVSQLKPHHDGSSSLCAARSRPRRRSSKTQNAEGSKVQSRTVERDESVASRKPRKRLLSK